MEVGAGYRSGSGAEALPAVLELVTRRLFRGFFSHLPRDAFSGFRSEGRSESGAAVGAGVMRGEQGGEGVSPGEGGGALPGVGLSTSQSSSGVRVGGQMAPVSWAPSPSARARLPFRSRGTPAGAHRACVSLSGSPPTPLPAPGGCLATHSSRVTSPGAPGFLEVAPPRGAKSAGRLASQGTDMHLHPSCLRGCSARSHLGRSSLIREAP